MPETKEKTLSWFLEADEKDIGDKPILKCYVNTKREDFNDDDRSFVAYASTESVDSDQEIIKANGWDLRRYDKSPVLQVDHSWSAEKTAGRAMWIKQDEKGLRFKPTFLDTKLGRDMFTAYKAGALTSFSVGFQPLEWTDHPGDSKVKRTITKANLLEISCVAIPANMDAIVQRMHDGGFATKSLQEAFQPIVDKVDEVTASVKTTIEVVKDADGTPIKDADGNISADITISIPDIDKADEPKEDEKVIDDTPIDEPVTKDTDLAGNPSIYDISRAIRRSLANTPEGERHVWVMDMFPVTNASGNAIVEFEEVGDGMRSLQWQYSYVYDIEQDSVTLFDPIAVEETYIPKSFEVKAGREMSGKNIAALRKASGMVAEGATAINDILERQANEPEKSVEHEKVEEKTEEAVLDIETVLSSIGKSFDELDNKIKEASASDSDIESAVDAAIKRSQGRLYQD